mmetsp:Transcript_8165/g.9453  ORF Transcript_8165/g.9453 Transcript_8165/m.9453 type:complete len:85 (+) Transcript_8165:1050-1304(+)
MPIFLKFYRVVERRASMLIGGAENLEEGLKGDHDVNDREPAAEMWLDIIRCSESKKVYVKNSIYMLDCANKLFTLPELHKLKLS